MSRSRLEALKEFLEKEPNDSFTRYALALEHQSLGQTETAIALLTEVLQRDPNYIPAYHQLGQLYTKLNKTQEAKEIYRKGIDMAGAVGEMHERDEMQEELEELEDER